MRNECLGLGMVLGLLSCSLLESGPGVEVTFPEDWRVSEISPSAYSELQRAAMPAIIALPEDPKVTAVVVGWDEEVQSGCVAFAAEVIEDGTGPVPPFIYPPEVGWSVILRAAGSAVPDPNASERVSWLPAGSDELIVPAGPAARVVHDLPQGRSGTQYSVTAGEGVLILACYADATPSDRWLSIVETLELLPDG